MNFLVDGERIPAGAMQMVDEDKTKTMVRQTVSVPLPYETFEKIANAKKVELQAGSLEYSLTPAHLEIFRLLLNEVTKPATPEGGPDE